MSLVALLSQSSKPQCYRFGGFRAMFASVKKPSDHRWHVRSGPQPGKFIRKSHVAGRGVQHSLSPHPAHLGKDLEAHYTHLTRGKPPVNVAEICYVGSIELIAPPHPVCASQIEDLPSPFVKWWGNGP